LEEWEEREGREKREGRKMAAILVPMAVQRIPLIARRCIAFTFIIVYQNSVFCKTLIISGMCKVSLAKTAREISFNYLNIKLLQITA
jgi:hypothetical protein